MRLSASFWNAGIWILLQNKIIKLIQAPAWNKRATGVVERLIQTIKRRIAIMQSDPLTSNSDLAQTVGK